MLTNCNEKNIARTLDFPWYINLKKVVVLEYYFHCYFQLLFLRYLTNEKWAKQVFISVSISKPPVTFFIVYNITNVICIYILN